MKKRERICLSTVYVGLCVLAHGCVGLDPKPQPLSASHFATKTPLPSLVPERIALRSSEPVPTGRGGPRSEEIEAGQPPSRVDDASLPPLEPKGKARVIDLAEALRLGGANSLQVAAAREELAEAQARLDQAEVLWLPNVWGGVGYNKHEGNIQNTEGDILQVSRNSGFVGGGVFASFDFADALLQPRSATYSEDAASAEVASNVNDTLLAVAVAYNDLLEAQAGLALANENTSMAEELVRLTEAFAVTGQGLEADAARARSELAQRKRLGAAAEQAVETRSARLAMLLRLDPAAPLWASEPRLVPFTLMPEDVKLTRLTEVALATRPEIRSMRSLVQAGEERELQETLRPFIPRLQVGVSGGGLGGGTGSDFEDFDGSGDASVWLLWEVRNFGFGEAARRRVQAAQTRGAEVRFQMARDAVAEQVAVAYAQSREGRRQVELAVENLKESLNSLDLNMQRIRAAEGLPIEALQALQAAALARDTYLGSVGEFNRAQFRLLRAVGRSVTADGR